MVSKVVDEELIGEKIKKHTEPFASEAIFAKVVEKKLNTGIARVAWLVMYNPVGDEIDYFLATTALDENGVIFNVFEVPVDNLTAQVATKTIKKRQS